MSEELIKFLSKYATFTDEDIQLIRDKSNIREFRKGSILLHEGQLAKNTYLVLKGCVRSYYLKGGNEKNTEFFIENDLIVPVSYVKNAPSDYFIECLEDCILSIGSSDSTEQIMKSHPQFASMCRKINEDVMANRQIAWDKFRHLSPEEHYLEIKKKKPALLERIPQYHLASYLGIQPQSLSRIRKRLTENA